MARQDVLQHRLTQVRLPEVDRSALLRLLLVEDHEIVRRGLHEMLRHIPFIVSVRSVDSVQAAQECLKLEPASALLVTSQIRDRDLEALVAAAPLNCRILVLLRGSEPTTLAAAARLRAHGFVLELGLTGEVLAEALKGLMNGQTLMPSVLANYLLSEARKGSVQTPSLTPREKQVLVLLTRGQSNKGIARELGISDHGAKRHVANVLAKLNTPNRTLAVARALNEHLLGNFAAN
jgi:DNA-binding NarL/FixJ family response regulator